MKQNIADYLIGLEKRIVDTYISFPTANNKLTMNVQACGENESFLLDINRVGKIKLSRCSFQERYNVTEGLVRLDLDETRKHANPDGTMVVGPHIHIYKEGYALRWAYALDTIDACPFTNISDLTTTFAEFCKYCNIKEIPAIQGSF